MCYTVQPENRVTRARNPQYLSDVEKIDHRVEMSYSDRIDVIDMIINVLKDHEGSLDEVVARLESLNKELVESSIAIPLKQNDKYDASMELLDYKIGELEKKIDLSIIFSEDPR